MHWNDAGHAIWALGCDFEGKDFSHLKSKGEMCSTHCAQNAECTHFAWTQYEGGTCWLKRGRVSTHNAVSSSSPGIVCGVIKGSHKPDFPPTPASSRTLSFKNNCEQTIWVGAQGNPLPENGGWRLDVGESRDIQVPKNFSAGRFWPRTGCEFVDGKFTCKTGDCGAPANNFGVACGGIGGQSPATLAEFTLGGWQGLDYYDISNVDGHSVGVAIRPKKLENTNDKFWCQQSECSGFDPLECPPELRMDDGAGGLVCASICAAVHNDNQRRKFSYLQEIYDDYTLRQRVCCAAPDFGNSPYAAETRPELGARCEVEKWPLPSTGHLRYDEVFKNQCPLAYSWQFDDFKSTYLCRNTDYEVVFCPKN